MQGLLSETMRTSVWFQDEHGCWCIYGRYVHIWMQARPPYCDRGRWLAHAESADPRKCYIDVADLWPRYYFDFDRAKAEVEAWMRIRKEWVEVKD